MREIAGLSAATSIWSVMIAGSRLKIPSNVLMFPAVSTPEANSDLPGAFQEILKGGPIPPVDAEDLKRMWELYRDSGKHAKGNFGISFEILEEVCSPGANVYAVWGRVSMLSMLSMLMQNGQLLDPWRHGEELDDIVFRVGATFPMEMMKRGVVYSGWPLDVDGFLQRLRQESGG